MHQPTLTHQLSRRFQICLRVGLLATLPTLSSTVLAQGFGGGTTGGGAGLGGGMTGGTGGLSGGQGGQGTGATGQNLGSTVNTSVPISPFGTNTAGNIFGGFTRTPQGFNNPLSTGSGGMGGTAGQAGRSGQLGGLGQTGLGGLGGRGGLGGLNQLGGAGNRNRAGGLNNNQNQNTNQNKVRAVMSLGFDGPAVNGAQVNSVLQDRLGRMSLPDRLKSIQVSVDGQTAVLKGTVASERDKKMMERLISLEPGVHAIKNEIQIKKP